MTTYSSYTSSNQPKGGSDTDIHTSRHSILHSSCIEPGKWTMTKRGQITYHSVDSKGETGVAYVFSLDKNDFKPIDSNVEERDKLNKQHRDSHFSIFH